MHVMKIFVLLFCRYNWSEVNHMFDSASKQLRSLTAENA